MLSVLKYFSIGSIILTLIALFTVRILIKYFIRPYFQLRELKKFKGAVCEYKPIMGFVHLLRKSEKVHGDAYYLFRNHIQKNPDIRFYASPLRDQIAIDLQDPELIKEFFAKVKSFEKDNRAFGVVSEFESLGLTFSEGERWKSQRKLISNVFHFEYMSGCVPHMNKVAEKWLQEYCKSSGSSIVNITTELRLYTALVVWNLFFGDEALTDYYQVLKDIQRILDNERDNMELITEPLTLIFGPKFYRLGLRRIDRKFKRDSAWIEEYCREKFNIYKKKLFQEKDKGTNDDHPKHLFELLIEASVKAEETDKFSELEIIAQIGNFLIAGTETTSNLLHTAHYFLAQYPDIQERMRQEVKSCIGDIQIVKHEHVAKMDYLTAFLKECLRMYGPASTIVPRIAKEDVVLKDLKIRKGYNVLISTHGLSNNPKYFSNPSEFRPERWIEKQDQGTKEPFLFMPFSAGPRKCIAEHLAYLEAKVFLVKILQRYKIDIKRPYEHKLTISATYGIKGPIHAVYTELQFH